MDLATKTHTEVFSFLEKEFKENETFRNELELLYKFYGRKLIHFVGKTDLQYVEEQFGEVVNSLYFQGYYTMRLILNDEETVLEEDAWKLPLGVVKNEIPLLLKNMLNDEKLDWSTPISHEFSMNILTNVEAGYETTLEITKEIAEYAAYKAFIEDERYIGGTIQETSEMLLGSPYDLNFLSPQVYSKAQFFTEQHETWDLFYWSAIQKDSWVGSIHFSTIPTGESNLYIIEFSISDVIMELEKLEIVEQITKKLPEEIRANLQTRLYHVSDLDVLDINIANTDNTEENNEVLT